MKTLERRNWFEHIMKHHSAFIEGRIARYAAPGFCDNRASFLDAPWRWWYKRGKILCDWSTLHVNNARANAHVSHIASITENNA